MAKKTPSDQLAAALSKVLAEYSDDVTHDVKQLAKKFAQKGAQAVKNAAKQFKGTGAYAKGWTSKYEEGRLSAQGIIFNKDLPGLPHLLEKSHALRQGGRTQPHPHIEPVERQVTEEFYKAVTKAI